MSKHIRLPRKAKKQAQKSIARDVYGDGTHWRDVGVKQTEVQQVFWLRR